MDNLLAYESEEESGASSGKRDVPRNDPPPKKARLPAPMPAAVPAGALLLVASLISSAAPTADSAKHKGKIRSFPHVEGNYPTHVYIPVTVWTNSAFVC